MPHISAVQTARRRRGGGEKEARVFYIAYVIRLSHECWPLTTKIVRHDENDGDARVSYPRRVARSPGPSTSARGEIVLRRPCTGRPIEKGPGIPPHTQSHPEFLQLEPKHDDCILFAIFRNDMSGRKRERGRRNEGGMRKKLKD